MNQTNTDMKTKAKCRYSNRIIINTRIITSTIISIRLFKIKDEKKSYSMISHTKACTEYILRIEKIA